MTGNGETLINLGPRKAEYKAMAEANGASLSLFIRSLLEAARFLQKDTIPILRIDIVPRVGRPRKELELKQ